MATIQRHMSVDSESTGTGSSQKSSPTSSPKLDRRRRSSAALKNGPHNYTPFYPRRASMAIRGRVCSSSEVFKDCRPIYPFIGLDGNTLMVSEFDFHVKMAKKYKALLGDRYIYPVLDETLPKGFTANDLEDITKQDKTMLDFFIPHEVELMVPGGIKTVKRGASEKVYIFAKQGDLVMPTAIKVVLNREMKEFQKKRETLNSASHYAVPSNDVDITSDEVVQAFIAGLEVPTVRRLRDLLGLHEDAEEAMERMKELGLLEKYLVTVDDSTYFKQRSRFADFGADYRDFKDDEEFDLSEFEKKNDGCVSDSEDSLKPCDSSFESEVDIEAHKLIGKNALLNSASCDSGLDCISPPVTPLDAPENKA